MVLKTIEEGACLVLFFDEVFLAKSNIDINKLKWIRKRHPEETILKDNWTVLNIHQLSDNEGPLLTTVTTKPTMLIHGRGKHVNLILMFR